MTHADEINLDDAFAAALAAEISENDWRLTRDIAAAVENRLLRFVARFRVLAALGELEDDGLVERRTDLIGWRAFSYWRWAPEPQQGGAA